MTIEEINDLVKRHPVIAYSLRLTEEGNGK